MHQRATADLYLRLSLDREGKTAIDRQEADCRAWAGQNGLAVRKVHIDHGRSGYKNVTRKGFDAVLRQLDARTFPSAGKRLGNKRGKSLLTGIARCELCGTRMSRAGTSYQCSNHRMGRGCPGVSARVPSVDDYVTRVFLSRLPKLGPQHPLLAVIADRWAQREDPEGFAKREVIEAELGDERARLADLEEARYVRGEFEGSDAVDRYHRLAGQLRNRIEGLRADLMRMPTPSVDVSPLLNAGLLCEAWEADDVAGRRERLALAIDRVEVRRGKVGVRFDGAERCRIVWAAPRSFAG